MNVTINYPIYFSSVRSIKSTLDKNAEFFSDEWIVNILAEAYQENKQEKASPLNDIGGVL